MIRYVVFGIGLGLFAAAFLIWKYWPVALLLIFVIALGRMSAERAKREKTS